MHATVKGVTRKTQTWGEGGAMCPREGGLNDLGSLQFPWPGTKTSVNTVRRVNCFQAPKPCLYRGEDGMKTQGTWAESRAPAKGAPPPIPALPSAPTPEWGLVSGTPGSSLPGESLPQSKPVGFSCQLNSPRLQPECWNI